MNIKTIKRHLLSAIDSISSSPELCCYHPGVDFTRKRKVTLKSLLTGLISMEGKSLSNEVIDIYKDTGSIPSPSAFVQQRSKLKPEAVYGVFHKFTESIAMHTEESFITLAVDGSEITIEAGIAEKVDVMAYANPAYSPEQMSILHGALNAEAQGYLTHADVLAVADPLKTVEAMRTELHALRKDPDTEQRTVAARETSEIAHGTKAPKRQNGKKKSVLEDLREKQAKIAGAEPHKSPGKRKTKEME